MTSASRIFITKNEAEAIHYYYGARYYDPKISVWLSVDPLATDYQNLPLTPYHFSANNPITYVDPDGLNWYVAEGEGEQAKPVWFDKEEQAQEHFGEQEFKDLGEKVHSFSAETGNQVYYGDEGESFEFSQMLSEVEIDGGEMSDHARAMQNPLVKNMHNNQDKLMREFGKTVLQDGGDAVALLGYGLTLTGVGASLGLPLAAVGNGMALTESAIELTYQIQERNVNGATTNVGFWFAGKAAGAAAKRIPGGTLARQILKQNAELKVSGLKRLVDYQNGQ